MNDKEQIKAMAKVLYGQYCGDDECGKCKQPNCLDYCRAERLYEAGFGDVKEYKRKCEDAKFAFCKRGTCEGLSDTCWKTCPDSAYNIVEDVKQALRDKIVEELAENIKQALRDKVSEDFEDMASDIKYITLDIEETENKIDELLKEKTE